MVKHVICGATGARGGGWRVRFVISKGSGFCLLGMAALLGSLLGGWYGNVVEVDLV